jgi:Rieske 2Fe-2S family protein
VEGSGQAQRFTCPYHGWTYGLDGALVAAAHLDRAIDRSRLGLKPLACEAFCGLVLVNLDPAAASFGELAVELAERLAPYELAHAKVADRRAYAFDANWKLALENYSECYHCAPAHPEYARAHALADPVSRYGAPRERVLATAPQVGLDARELACSHNRAPAFGADFAFQHYALLHGQVTGSEDGRPVAPLLGGLDDYHGGCVDLQFGPFSFGLAYDDHLVIYAFRPVDRNRSVCDISWLVRGDAKPGRDYHPDRLTWLWDVTTRADQRIVEANARGVASRFYEPGPLSAMEAYLDDFLTWYTEALATPPS